MRFYIATLFFSFFIFLVASPELVIGSNTSPKSDNNYIAIIIDDLGHDLHNGQRAIKLPGPVTYAILPHTKYGRKLATAAHNKQKEILLHQPMQSLGNEDPGPGKIIAGMPNLEIAITIKNNLKTVPHAIGINNHMGSLLTQSPREMAAVMATIQEQGNLFFIDSLTTNKSIASDMAAMFEIPIISRNIFLDSDRNEKAINKQFDLLLQSARRQGSSLAIGHPYSQTLSVLEKRLPQLAQNGIQLIFLSELVKSKNQSKGKYK